LILLSNATGEWPEAGYTTYLTIACNSVPAFNALRKKQTAQAGQQPCLRRHG
jgi:hypothetical protein